MNLVVQTKSGTPIYEQIEKQLKEEILAGRLRTGEPLPSIRSLAADLKISVITTKRAYEDLEKEGMIYSVPGKGFFVDNPDLQYLQEKKTIRLEENLKEIISQAKQSGISKADFASMVDIFWEA